MLINGHGRNDRSCWYGSNRKRNRNEIEHLTFNEIVNIIDGQVLGGNKGITKMVSKFAIGAMELKDILKYIGPKTLLIVGNREDAD